jgi:hypothetical protein
MFLDPGAKNVNETIWWPQRDSNPCLAGVTFSPRDSMVCIGNSRENVAASKHESLVLFPPSLSA